QMLAIRRQEPPRKIEETFPLKPEIACLLAGRYKSGETRVIDLEERSGRLWALAQSGGFLQELRAQGDHLIVDDIVAYGQQVVPESNPALSSISASDAAREGQGVAKLRIGKNTYKRIAIEKPAPPPARWSGLIGEYGWDHDILYMLEKDGKLYALIEWFF